MSSWVTPTRQGDLPTDGERLEAGDRLTMNDLASTMEILAEGGAEAFYDGVLAERDHGLHPCGRRPADEGRPPRLPRDLASSDHRRVPRAPIRLESAAVHRRRADRLRPSPARPRRPRRPAGERRRDRPPGRRHGRAGACARAGLRTPAPRRRPGARLYDEDRFRGGRAPHGGAAADHSGAGRAVADDPDLGRRRGRQRRLADGIDRRGLGRSSRGRGST